MLALLANVSTVAALENRSIYEYKQYLKVRMENQLEGMEDNTINRQLFMLVKKVSAVSRAMVACASMQVFLSQLPCPC